VRRWSWAAVVAVAVALLVYGTVDAGGARTDEDRVEGLAETIKCPTCRSQSAADSDAPASRAIRTEIARRVDAGQSDGEIRAYFRSRYGEEILLTPSSSGVAGLVWILPVAALVVAVFGLGLAFRRWRRWQT
jgi:cytochrome c-type biogenesis protein CcmH